MRCVSCGTDNNLRDRTLNQGRCRTCGHQFAFEPSTVTDARFKFTDPFFAKAINDISISGTLYFTPKQLFYLLDRRLSRKSPAKITFLKGAGWIISVLTLGFLLPVGLILFAWGCFNASRSEELSPKARRGNARTVQVIGGIILVLGIVFSLSINSYLSFAASVIFGMLFLYLGYRQLRIQKTLPQRFFITETQFQGWLSRWQLINNPISKMLPEPREELAPAAVSPDISAYSFDRAIICDNSAISQMLIANNFHFENNCAVLSITGYPQAIFGTVMQMLLRNPELKVYALHDASPQGVSLVHQLRTSPNWFQNSNVMIYDLGLLPRQILNLGNAFVQGSQESTQQARQLPPDVRQSLSSDELEWLEAGNFVELESFSPRRIIQVLNRGIVQSQEQTSSDSLILVDDGGYGGVGYVYAVDSFG
ncbi:MAG: hypothetical protein LDL41_13130 [Coleofasciculus sp. S288]|nr:hypothetical protein [Coleofasciculus sp. S288]